MFSSILLTLNKLCFQAGYIHSQCGYKINRQQGHVSVSGTYLSCGGKLSYASVITGSFLFFGYHLSIKQASAGCNSFVIKCPPEGVIN